MRTQNPESINPPDRQRWDLRYREGAYAQRHWPSAYLQQLHQGGVIPDDGRALDIACGRGRNGCSWHPMVLRWMQLMCRPSPLLRGQIPP